jgi:hypothetical protein
LPEDVENNRFNGFFLTGSLKNFPDTLLEIAPLFPYAVESPGS